MLQRFALIWPALCLASMGAHVFVEPSVPSPAGIGVTAVLTMPLAAIAARFSKSFVLALAALFSQLVAHASLQLNFAGVSMFGSHHSMASGHVVDASGSLSGGSGLAGGPALGMDRLAETGLMSQVSPHVHSHTLSHVSLEMMMMHALFAVILAVLVCHVDEFIAMVRGLFGRRFTVLRALEPVAAPAQAIVVYVVPRPSLACLDFSLSRRGPPVP